MPLREPVVPIDGRIMWTWIALIAVVGSAILVMVLPNLFPESELLRWLRYLFVLVVFPAIVIYSVRLSKRKPGTDHE